MDGASPIVVSREKKENPFTAANAPAGQKLKTDRINSALTSLTALAFTETNDPTDTNAVAAKEHSRVFKLTTFEGKTYTVALGRKPEEKKIKPPTANPAALGKSTDLLSSETVDGVPPARDAPPATPLDPKLLAPEFETTPAGPVYAIVSSTDEKSPMNALSQRRAFQVADYVYTGLPQKSEDLFGPAQ